VQHRCGCWLLNNGATSARRFDGGYSNEQYAGGDGAVYIRWRSEHLDGQHGRPLGEDPLVRIGPGEEFEGRTFEEWRALMEADIAREVERWHSLLRKRGRAQRLRCTLSIEGERREK
jgi:hypothetical protein